MKVSRKLLPFLIILVLAVLIIPATIYLALTSQELRGRAFQENCVKTGQRCSFRTPCCLGLVCMGGICQRAQPTPTPFCQMIAQGCGPRECGGMKCEAGSMCLVNSCSPTNTVCIVDSRCVPEIGKPTPTPTMSSFWIPPTSPTPPPRCGECLPGQTKPCVTTDRFPGTVWCLNVGPNCFVWGNCVRLPTPTPTPTKSI